MSSKVVRPSTKNKPVNLKVMLLNAENLFLLSDQKLEKSHLDLSEKDWQRLSTSIYDNKPLHKLSALHKIIHQMQPDVIMLAEVGGAESLENFNRLFLEEKFQVALTEGNSDRHIDVGYLIRKDLGCFFDLVSNKNRPLNYLYPHERENLSVVDSNLNKIPPSQKFSRDVAELHLFKKDRSRPFLVFLLSHLKSRLDREGIDPNGFERRQAELKTLLEIYKECEQKFNFKVPIVLGGDFNGNAAETLTEPEFKQIYENTQLRDVCELAQLPAEARATYYQVSRNSRVLGKQIDYSFLSPLAAQFLDRSSVQVYRYRSPKGDPLDPPMTLDAKLNLPSDHYPLFFELQDLPVID